MLGSTGVRVSKLCFGTMSFGGDADEATSAAMFNKCRDEGINFFDCANIYSGGKAEEILGKLIAGCRDELVITSKFGMDMSNMLQGAGRRCDLSRRHMIQCVEESLKRLGTDRLDVYFCHHNDPQTPIDETLQAMEDLVRQGKIRYPAVSNWSAWQIEKALGVAGRYGLSEIAVIQPTYNLVNRTAEIEIFPCAQAEGLAVIPYSPLAAGLLTGKYTKTHRDETGRLSTNKMYAKRFRQEIYFDIAERFTEYANHAGVHPVTLAVAWSMAHPAVTAPIIGARNTEQLEASLAASDYEISAQQWKEISDLTPPVPRPTDRDEERPN